MNNSFLGNLWKFVLLFFLSLGGTELASLLLDFRTPVPMWLMALVLAAGIALIAKGYAHERGLISPGKGKILASLRTVSFLVLFFVLLEPVYVGTVSRNIERCVAVILDTSGSMRFTDRGWTPSEKVSLALSKGIAKKEDIPCPGIEKLAEALEELRPWILHGGDQSGKKPGRYSDALKKALKLSIKLEGELKEKRGGHPSLPGLAALHSRLEGELTPRIKLQFSVHTPLLAEAIDAAMQELPEARKELDALLLDSLAPEKLKALEEEISTNRLEIAEFLLSKTRAPLSENYTVRYFEMGRETHPAQLDGKTKPSGDKINSGASDFSRALEHVSSAIPSEELAGILMVTDGIDNSDASPEPAARLLASRGVKISTLLVGGSEMPKDISIGDISAPESVFLGDKARVRVRIRATGCKGNAVKARLLLGEQTVDERPLKISEDFFERDVMLSHSPTNSGLASYEIAVDEIEGELFSENNRWKADIAVSDDRTHLLIADDFPRWEFRYLRNLFFARDKSVHLQYMLASPDSIKGIEATNRLVSASASRPFGEAEAGALPENEDEWKKFNTIILGDLPESLLTEEKQQIIARCVEERGALLVVIAGQRAMPHAYRPESTLRNLLPCTFPANAATGISDNPPEKEYMLKLTPVGKRHPVMRQSSSNAENEEFWNGIEPWKWRFPVSGIKPGAEILAYATLDGANAAPATLEEIDRERETRARRAIIAVHQVGKGKVLQINSDETWRLRYRAGDVHHHKFWGQVLRWGLGERLRSGNEFLRIGSEKLTYAPREQIRFMARILDKNLDPVGNAAPRALVLPQHGENGGGKTASLAFSPVEGSQGLYEAFFSAPEKTGAYKISMENPEKYGAGDECSTLFFVAAAKRPIEMSCVGAKDDTAKLLARLTAGRVFTPRDFEEIPFSFGEKKRTAIEPVEYSLRTSKWLLWLFLAALSAEWILKKRFGLV